MGEEDKFEFWGLSLSLKPPRTTHLDHKPIFKRESKFSSSIDDEQSPKLQKYNNTLMMMPWNNHNNNNINDKNKGVEQKTPPLVIDLEDAEINKTGSPNSTLSSSAAAKRLGGFSGETEMMISDDEGGSGSGGGSRGRGGERKKLRLTREQIMVLEQAFREHTTLNTKQKVALAKQVNLRPRQVEVWFQNRRARTKLKQTEVECEQLRRFCETMTEENKRLQNEVQELRALKVSPEQAIHPPTTLTMCPSCKSVSHSSSSAAPKTPPSELGRCPVGVFHRPVPLNLKKLSLAINNNRMLDSHLSRS